MIDVVIVVLYLIAIPVIGILNRRKLSNFQSLTSISKKLQGNKLLLIATIFASTIGGGTTFGVSEKAFADNIAHAYGLILVIPIDLAIAAFILPKLIRHYQSETIGDIMSCYYGSAGRLIGGISAILVSTGLLAAQISVSGRIFEYILEIDYFYGVIISYSIIIIYTTIGGLQSIIFANQLQFFAIIFAIPVISIVGVMDLGMEQLIKYFPLEKVSFSHDPDLLPTTISLACSFAVVNLLPTFIQRALINQDSAVTKRAIYIKSAIYLIFLLFVTLNGILAFIYYPNVKASLALPYLINQIIPAGLQGLVVVGLLAAVMSTADSDLNIISISLTKDVIQPALEVKPAYMAIIARLANIIVGILAIIIALNFVKIVDLVIFISGFWAPITLVPLVLSLYDITISRMGYYISVLSGVGAFLMWHALFESTTSLKAGFIGALANLVIYLLFYVAKQAASAYKKSSD